MADKNSSTLSLVLGSGGARGLAHIGVIHWLEEQGFTIKSISGCSIGALVGGIYAAGKLDEFEDWVRGITKKDMVKLVDLSWSNNGLVKGNKLIETLTELVGDKLIEDLPMSYTAIAADIYNEKEVWLNSGRLFDAIRASISLPLIFTPYDYNGEHLIDGGVLNPVPIAPTFNDETDFTVAVNLVGKVDKAKQRAGGDNKSGKEAGFYDIANQAFDAMQGTIARQKLAAYPADHFVQVPRNACGMLEFDRAAEMIDLGYKLAKRSLNELA